MVPQLFGTLQVFQQFIGLHPGIELAQREDEEDPQMSSWSERNIHGTMELVQGQKC
jgi:hypothetical protein